MTVLCDIILLFVVWHSSEYLHIRRSWYLNRVGAITHTLADEVQCRWTLSLQRKQRISHFQLLGNHKKIAELPIETHFTDSHIFMMIMIPATVIFPVFPVEAMACFPLGIPILWHLVMSRTEQMTGRIALQQRNKHTSDIGVSPSTTQPYHKQAWVMDTRSRSDRLLSDLHPPPQGRI